MGLAVAANPHYTLGTLYGKILRTLQKMPESSVYRRYTEQIVKERAAVLKQVLFPLLAVTVSASFVLTSRTRSLTI